MRGMSASSLPSTASAGLAFGQSRLARGAASALRAADRVAPGFAARLAVGLFFMPFPTKLASRRRPPTGWTVQQRGAAGEGYALLRRRDREAGSPRPAVLLVHGWAGDALQMLPLADAVAQAGFEPVLMDLPAHGRSPGWRCTMPQIVRGVFDAEAAAGPFDAVVAHSMGSVAVLHALAHGLRARRVVALAPSSPPASVLRWFGDVFRLSPALLERMRARIEGHEAMAMAQFEAAWLGPRVHTPVLLVHDRGDRLAPVGNAEALAAALHDAAFHPTDGLSHRRVLSDAGVARRVLAFLEGARP